jgi:hypothetical protein
MRDLTMRDIPVTDREAALLLVAKLHAFGWRFSLDPLDGQLLVQVGYDPPDLTQDAVFALVWPLEDALTGLLAAVDGADASRTIH